jgi:hypothetical protein
MRKRNRSVVAVIGAIAMVIGISAPAAADPVDLSFVPNDSAQFIINTPPNVLEAAANSEDQAAMLAEADRINLALYEPQFAPSSGVYTATPVDPALALSPSDAEAFAADTADFAAPATKMLALAKVVDGANVAVDGFQFGLQVGAAGARLAGFKDDTVCEQRSGALDFVASVLDGTDCLGFDNALDATQKNIDIMPVSSFPSTTLEGVTVSYQSGEPWPQLATNELTCFTSSGTRPAGYRVVVQVWGADGTTNSTGTSEANSYCPAPSNLSGWWVTAPLTSYQVLLAPPSGSNDPIYQSDVIEGTVSTPNPQRNIKCDVLSTTGHLYTSTSASFTENDSTLAAVSCPALPAGEVAANVSIYEIGAGLTNILQHQNTTDAYRDWRDAFPECANGSCPLMLSQGASNCFAVGVDCDGWFIDPSKASDYSCSYGTHAEDLSWCTIYAHVFDPDALATGHAYSNPATGDAISGKSSPTSQDRLVDNLLSRPAAKVFRLVDRKTQAAYAIAAAAACLASHALDECETNALWIPGDDVEDVANHDLDAITAGYPAILTYVTGSIRAETLPRHWYTSASYGDGLCAGTAPTSQDCDEYPYYSSAQSSTSGSLRYVDSGQNRSEGAKRHGLLARVCHLDTKSGSDADFIVLPMPVAVPTIGFCAPVD